MAPDECPVSLPIHQTQLENTILVLTPANIKGFIVMTLLGLEYIVCKLLTHWELNAVYDLKPNNLLLDKNGLLKLSDFCLSKTLGSPTVYTHQVVSHLWRGSPELFSARMHGVGVDMWAMDCVLAELPQPLRVRYFTNSPSCPSTTPHLSLS
uniref:[RNA-polymerase]-subunit kinase n=1 Tax=Oncorhynchus mykiss TaxID=8022 RepID=A0A8C7Q4S8_ONCMY